MAVRLCFLLMNELGRGQIRTKAPLPVLEFHRRYLDLFVTLISTDRDGTRGSAYYAWCALVKSTTKIEGVEIETAVPGTDGNDPRIPRQRSFGGNSN